LSDILKYRIPGELPVSKTGLFRNTKDLNDTHGFLLSDFEAKELYVFQENQNDNYALHFLDKQPFVVSHEEYLNQADSFLNTIIDQKIGKAVLSRVKAVDFDEVKTMLFFDQLVHEYPNAFVYLISSAVFGTWIGATPEMLFQSSEGNAFTTALAGTKSSIDLTEWGVKEQEEQQMVTDFILDELNAVHVSNIKILGPYDAIAGPVKHLKSDIRFDLNGIDQVEIIKTLHPTPAVSGFPQKQAIELIRSTEKHDRGLYTGIIGLLSNEKTEIFVNLRCCQIQKGKAYLYLGGGFTKDSIPESEWLETENKSKTLLNILQNQ
jgi:isochorismate synthase